MACTAGQAKGLPAEGTQSSHVSYPTPTLNIFRKWAQLQGQGRSSGLSSVFPEFFSPPLFYGRRSHWVQVFFMGVLISQLKTNDPPPKKTKTTLPNCFSVFEGEFWKLWGTMSCVWLEEELLKGTRLAIFSRYYSAAGYLTEL